jgi:hypothetical protein
MKLFSILILLLLFVFTVSAQQDEELPVYQLKQIYQNADLNEKAIERFQQNIKLRSEFDEIMKLFKPIKGKYKVILFMSANYGLSGIDDKKDIFHNILILKINKNNEILDGLQYILEWAEPPFTARFVRATKKGVKLIKGLRISELDFRTFETNFQEKFNFWKIDGVIDNLYNFKEVF